MFKLIWSVVCMAVLFSAAPLCASAQLLTHVETVFDGALERVRAVTTSADGAQVYVNESGDIDAVDIQLIINAVLGV